MVINIIKTATPHEVKMSNSIPAKHSQGFLPYSLLKPENLSGINVWAVPIDIVAGRFFTPPLKEKIEKELFSQYFLQRLR
jgi:hypothetical protein